MMMSITSMGISSLIGWWSASRSPSVRGPRLSSATSGMSACKVWNHSFGPARRSPLSSS
eukprot:CAMPEP_0176007138 /NCGR_PEP_ID=MMETSP0120_2-20121206/3077_1 /TAXON_ID=160619 /ORGANISM="Kryptoperidinium foliaceum, Strain CCMP 1326" /LENGTH=58 /DNA_ID=CAMNT_0017339887 /DNA_START=12 /DNA_END=184 /DNA_ORIENTATION=+